MELDIKLKNKWSIYYHRMDEMSWDRNSYIKIFEFDTIVNYFKFKNSMNNLPSIYNGYYFFMKDNILPIWEDTNNTKGGSWNIKISKNDLQNVLNDILLHLLSNELLQHYNDTITGISVVPKKYNCIIKIWNNNNKICSNNLLNKRLNYLSLNDIVYKLHVDRNAK